ncbi:hypothetical protein A0256_20660 [Mucilaginibacter sp. PAMC 26640]|nr:hypothetical protein A0256_20660 [Mucilaginibacter sp. PAMC 26640]
MGFESHQIASKIYDDMDRNGRKPDEAYYQAKIPVVQQRIEMAGIRLAGTHNELFKYSKVFFASIDTNRIVLFISTLKTMLIRQLSLNYVYI